MAPRYETAEGNFFNNLDSLRVTSLSMLRPWSEVLLVKANEKKDQMGESINILRITSLLVCQMFCDKVTDALKRYTASTDIPDLHEYIGKMDGACAILSTELGYGGRMLDTLKDELEDPNRRLGYGGSSLVDVQCSSPLIILMSFLKGDELQLKPFLMDIKRILEAHISLLIHAKLTYITAIKPKHVREFTSVVTQNPQFWGRITNRASESSRSYDNVYKVSEMDHLRIQYPNVIKLFGVGQVGDTVFLVTNWVSGGNLAMKMRDLSLDQLVNMLAKAFLTMYIVHRGVDVCIIDIKPENIMLDEEANPILCDFGSCYTYGEVLGQHGTDMYRGYGNYATYSWDMYSFGITIFELLTIVPFGEPGFNMEILA